MKGATYAILVAVWFRPAYSAFPFRPGNLFNRPQYFVDNATVAHLPRSVLQCVLEFTKQIEVRNSLFSSFYGQP
jgi:hypothetical protein